MIEIILWILVAVALLYTLILVVKKANQASIKQAAELTWDLLLMAMGRGEVAKKDRKNVLKDLALSQPENNLIPVSESPAALAAVAAEEFITGQLENNPIIAKAAKKIGLVEKSGYTDAPLIKKITRDAYHLIKKFGPIVKPLTFLASLKKRKR